MAPVWRMRSPSKAMIFAPLAGRVEIARRLVGQYEARTMFTRARAIATLQLAAREFARQPSARSPRPTASSSCCARRSAASLMLPLQPQRQHDVLAQREMRQYSEKPENKTQLVAAQTGQGIVVEAGVVGTIQHQTAAIRAVEPGDQVLQR